MSTSISLESTCHDSTAHHVNEHTDSRVPNAAPGIDSERIALDGGHADVDVTDHAVEVTVTIGNRAGIGLALSPAEAARISEALRVAAHRAHIAQAAQIDLAGVETVTDLFHRSQETGVPASALIEVTR